ncbi:hypothetical protein QN372_16200 [Undibacterium sp. RTI2.1]|uniref:hypothetical protein n=1 Tax=unclassified Undibacterium TaxID=2630295 RepID=UPI002AB32A5B|nr:MULTISPECIES: hypothetical protein [unclassified Undibacterium]MDY7540766.1 hypothetical protein [Undibacterium sp. 5I1]MEB0032301.1 hypothetical protein [Undibacterium sp. RTI2.1]MEB0118444.1 hypothetical protein [Undibacterium sp. RTI2.2]MEB0233151.1 hypothetical protein [Undibacterium sp. 10I3]MEB0259430.1 hypothetical protein [Undibacterium sp. 5I1]
MLILVTRFVLFGCKLFCAIFIGAWQASVAAHAQVQEPGWRGLWRFTLRAYFSPLGGAIEEVKQQWRRGL